MRSFVLAGLLLSTGCVGLADPALVTASLQTASGADSGATPAEDAGTNDAGASVPDAGAAPVVDAGSPAVDAGVDPCAGITCMAAGARCERTLARCVCGPGFTGDGSSCTPVAPGTPETRTSAQVCTAWSAAQTRKEAGDGFSNTTTTCDPGAISRNALDDALARLNFYRWLVGLGPTADDSGANSTGQACAVVSAWNPAGPAAHFPQSSATCYTQAGAGGAGSSNIAWGARDATDAIDLWMIDFGNETTFGHRRWLLNPPLGPVGIGHYRGGNNYGSASCISVFGSSGSSVRPEFVAFPPPGFSPLELTQWHWTIHGNIPLSGTTVSVTRTGDGVEMPTRLEILNGSYGQATVAVFRDGWNPVAGQTYHVRLVGTGGLGVVEYDVKPTSCP
ncbi:MAG: CAP domain-containing protein [Archangium sp.]|nr:CAP domain-containing protein [Archangium sp.]MDP3569942.1 CAP domain-containing protein [Archangium sp.]